MGHFEVSVLGANATAPNIHGASSSYLVTSETGYILVDAGPGSLMAYTMHHDLDSLRGIVITHLHADHSLDLMAWAYRWAFPVHRKPIPLFIPTGERQKLISFDDLFGIATLPGMREPIAESFSIQEMPLDEETVLMVDGVHLTTFEAFHAVPSAALRFTRNGKSLTFSSDTGDCAGLRSAAHNSDLFVCEATYLDPKPEAMRKHGHLTPALAGTIAHESGARALVLTHLTDPDDAAESQRRAEETFGKQVSVARAGLTFTV